MKSDKGACKRYSTGVSAQGMAGQALKAAASFDLPMSFLDKYENVQQSIVMTNISKIKKANYNLCSLTRWMMNGWTMEGTKRAIIMTSPKGVQI